MVAQIIHEQLGEGWGGGGGGGAIYGMVIAKP